MRILNLSWDVRSAAELSIGLLEITERTVLSFLERGHKTFPILQ